MKILVTTPTGTIGRRILAELLAPEFSVRVIARNPSLLPQDIQEQVEVVRASTDNAATLRQIAFEATNSSIDVRCQLAIRSVDKDNTCHRRLVL